MKRLDRSFYERDVLLVAPELIGKTLVRQTSEETSSYIITETEAYQGIEDKASHARFGKTPRNSIMFGQGGFLYVYFIYGMYWMINVVTGEKDMPQAVLIRGLSGISGPGRLTRKLQIDRSFNGEDLIFSQRIWIEDAPLVPGVIQKPRWGIGYAGEPWISKPWRFILDPSPQKS